MRIPGSYDQDYCAWIAWNFELLRAGSLSGIDAEHIAEELESMGKRDPRQLRSRLQVLTTHLLQWRYQPNLRGTSWLATIDHRRDEIEALLLDSPSLRGALDDALAWVYPKAVRDAARETGLPEVSFPKVCPHALDQILVPGFLPD